MGNFPKFMPKNSKLFVLAENWRSRYLGGADSDSGLRFLIFWSQNPSLGKFGLKKSKFSVFPENWHAWYLGGVNSESGLRFLKFRFLKSIFGQIWNEKIKFLHIDWKLAHRVSGGFWFLFRHYFGPKIQISPFWLKIGTNGRNIKEADSYSEIRFLNFQT